MTRKELDELKEDKDMDGIPDKYDSTFNPPDEKYHYAVVTPSLCEYLKEHDFSFSKCIRETENIDLPIRFYKSDKSLFQELSADFIRNERRVRK